MKYRLTITLFIDDEERAEDIFRFLEGRKALFRSIKPGSPDELKSLVRLERCYHDEEPVKPCELLKEFTSD